MNLKSKIQTLWRDLVRAFLDFVKKVPIVRGGLVIFVIVSLWSLTTDVLRDVVYVDTFELPEEFGKKGISPKQFTDRAVQAAQFQIDEGKAASPPALTSAEWQKRASSEPNSCLTRQQPLRHLLTEFKSEIKSKPMSEWQRTTLVLSEVGISLRTVSDAVRRVLNMPAGRISGSIVEMPGTDKYSVRVSIQFSPTETQVSELPAKDISDAEQRTSMLILKYANPAVYASKVNFSDLQGVSEALISVPKQWKSLHSPSLPYTIIGYLVLNNQEKADQYANLKNAETFFRRALQHDKDDVLAEIGSIVVELILSSDNKMPLQPCAIKSDCFSGKGASNSSANPLNEISRQAKFRRLDELGAQGAMGTYAYIVKATLHERIGENDDALIAMEKAFTARPDDADVILNYALFLIRVHKFEAAEELLARLRPENNLPDWRFVIGKAILKAESKSIEAGSEFVNPDFHDPCALAMWVGYINTRASNETDTTVAAKLRKQANIGYALAEREGIRGFHFYNEWGGLLYRMGRYDEAIERFERAQYFFGDKVWALVNIGGVQLQQERAKEAESSFRESLKLGPVPRAIEGYLISIFQQKEYRRFLDEYESRRLDLVGAAKQKLAIVAAIAQCELGETIEPEVVLQMGGSSPTDAQIQNLYSYLNSRIKAKCPCSSATNAVVPSSRPEAKRK